MRSRSRLVVLPAAGALVAGLLAATAPGSAAAPPAPAPADDSLEVYVGQVLPDRLSDVVDLGVDRHELEVTPVTGPGGDADKGLVELEVVLSGDQADELADQGVELELKQVDGQTVTERADAAAADGYEVWQRYSGRGGLRQEVRGIAADHPGITKLVRIGRTVRGTPITAIKVTERAGRTEDGARPAVLYLSAQHAREWITPEMTTRLLARVVERYAAGDRRTQRLLARTELWFVPVANPDGYDYTFTEGNRLWRKNLADNNGDGQTAPGDGVDLNRNWPYKWGYDNEGSSPDPASETYRGAGPASEPETKALDRLADRVDFEFLVNYHSAAELLLYGTGWQVATPSPDDLIYEALAGDDEDPAVPGYDPDLSAELYTTNGDTDSGITERYGALGFTPEMSSCEAASEVSDSDEWEAADCGSGFEFPDDERLVRGEFAKNVPFALSVARSAGDPDDPRSALGLGTPDFDLDSFDVSTGTTQTVAVDAKRALSEHQLRYRIRGEVVRRVEVARWRGGERYGTDGDEYYGEYRGLVRGARPGDRVRVWFTARDDGRRGRGALVRSKSFRYTVARDTGADVLVVADEDYTGVNPTYPDGTDAPSYAAAHVRAVEDAGYTADVWDVDAQGVPHDLGVLSHYDAVLWYLGDNRLTQDPEDELTDSPFGALEDVSVAERAQDLTLAVRDYLNEGGKLIHSGETAQYQGNPNISGAVGGLYYGLNGDPTAECVISDQAGFFEDCLILADDFRQYYLGGFSRFDVPDPTAVRGRSAPLDGYARRLGGPVVEGSNPLDEAGAFQVTSDVLPVEDFPQFASRGSALYPVEDGSPFAPVEGDRYAGVLHADNAYARLTRTLDLTAATSAELQMAVSWSTEEAYDHLLVEARTAGGEDWTTLAEAGGATTTDPPAECEPGGFLFDAHPFLRSYLGGADCSEPGTTGTWNALTGVGGWSDLAYDLGDFAGSDVEVSVSYVSDPAFAGVGAFVDDTRVEVDGADRPELADGFEGGTSLWAPGSAPPGSPPATTQWEIGGTLVESIAATSTEDTLLLGFGLEQLASDQARTALVRRALKALVGPGG